MRWPWERRDYTGDVTAAVTAALDTGGRGPGPALEAACGYWQRAFASAKVENAPDAVIEALTPEFLGMVGRGLVRYGNLVAEIQVNDMIRLHPATWYQVEGATPDPSGWTYRMTRSHPDSNGAQATLTVRRWAQVLHFRFATDQRRPWVGISPVSRDLMAGDCSGAFAISSELNTATFKLLPVDAADTVLDDLKASIKALVAGKTRGGVIPVKSRTHERTRRDQRPMGDWAQATIGPENAAIPPLRDNLALSILSAAGVPPALAHSSDSAGQREAYRQFVNLSVLPIAAIVQHELRGKLDAPDLTLSFDALGAGDITGKARAFQSFVQGGMDIERAAMLTGVLAPT